MRVYSNKHKEPKHLEATYKNWLRGLNTTVSNTQIKPNELSEATDIELVEDGKIQVPRTGQAYYGSTSGSRVTGLHSFYKSDGTDKLIRTCGTILQEYNTSSTGWDTVSGTTYTTTLDTQYVTAYDRAYICNGTDALTYYDGTDITTFTAISAPAIDSVTRTGGDGTYTFSYKITAVTAVGETTTSAASSATIGVADLDDSNYMTIAWTAVDDATGYNVYGRKDGDWRYIAYLEGNGSVEYVDKATSDPSEVFTAPLANTTGGVIGKYITLYKDSLFILGEPNNPSRLYYSGGGDHINDFTLDGGGGFIDVSRNDGQIGTGMIMFKDALLVFKERSIYKFTFNTSSGLPQIEQVNASIGCVASRSIVPVENDILFMSSIGVYTLGNEAGFAFDVLRTNELSARVRTEVKAIDSAYLSRVAAIYVNDASKKLVIFSYTPSGSTTNSEALIWDRERLAWYKWTNITASCWGTWIDSDSETHYLYGDDGSGYVKEILSGSDDFGSNISGSVKLRAEDFDFGYIYKKLKNIDILIREPVGTVSMSIIVDVVTTERTLAITTLSPSVNWGHYTFTDFTFGDSVGTSVSAQDENILRTVKNINLEGRSFMLRFENNSSGSFTVLQTHMKAKPRSENYRHSGDLVSSS